MMRWGLAALLAFTAFITSPANAAEHEMKVELNALDAADKGCRITFVVHNSAAAVDSLKLDLVIFDAEGVIHRRIITELGPVRSGRTNVRIFPLDSPCPRIGSVLVNDVTACVPGAPNECLDGLTLASRVKDVRFYK